MRSKFVLFSILLVLLTFDSYNQDHLPRMDVLPFSALNVSKSETEVISGLSETALVNIGVHNVIEQAQTQGILTVQEFLLSDCASSPKNS